MRRRRSIGGWAGWGRTLLCAVAIALAAMPLAAMKHPRRDARQAVLALEEQWRQAQLAGDTQTMDRMLADDYLGVSPFGVMSTKAQTLSRAQAHAVVFSRLDIKSEKVKIVGSIAIVTSSANVAATMDGRELSGRYLYTRIYRRNAAGVWRITSFEATPVSRREVSDRSAG